MKINRIQSIKENNGCSIFIKYDKSVLMLCSFGLTAYYMNGFLNRNNGPAIIYAEGRKSYHKNVKKIKK